ncbi:hypothetical protein VNI00_017106 [Paramarasmius palmivorus]|uniref:Uncharacterized protein n=1 Tax=Paramarasmius palmivorus TaxID=297713 RepID=A0AAW0B8P5_9AGAR
MRQEGREKYVHLLTINRDIAEEYVILYQLAASSNVLYPSKHRLYPVFYTQITIYHRITLALLLTTLNNNPVKSTLTKSLYIRLGCTNSIIPKNLHPITPPSITLTCRLKEKHVCHHLRVEDTPKLHELASIYSESATTFVLHSNRPTPYSWRILQYLSFSDVTDVEAPIEVLSILSPHIPFPNATRMRLSVISDATAGRTVDRHDFRQYTNLRYLLLSYWDVQDDTMNQIMNHLRVPNNIVCVGLEQDQGNRLPCTENRLQAWLSVHWLTMVMSPEGLDLVSLQWRCYFDQELFRHAETTEELLDDMFTINTCDGDDIWQAMESQVLRKNVSL